MNRERNSPMEERLAEIVALPTALLVSIPPTVYCIAKGHYIAAPFVLSVGGYLGSAVSGTLAILTRRFVRGKC